MTAGSASSSQSTSPVMSAAARTYLDAALHLQQTRAVNRARLDWLSIRQQALHITSGAVTTADTYPAIALAVGELGVNGHSRLVPLPADPIPGPRPVGPSQLPSGKLLPGQVGYIALPGVDQSFADQYQTAGATVMRTL